jgi:RNA polymerase sigma-70 factor (ECF subfamily)
LRSPATSISEPQLVALLKRRDKGSFALLYNRYAANLYGIVCRVVQSPEAAQDVLQDAFVKIWVNIDAYDPAKGALFTWLLNVTRRTAIDYLRAHKRRQGQCSLEGDTGTLDRYVYYEPAIDTIGLEPLLASLPFQSQLLIDHFYFMDYTQEQVAQTFGMPLGTVKTRLRAAIRHLRNAVAEPAS